LIVDTCVIGAGPAGSTVAGRLAQLGYRVCLLERAETSEERRIELFPVRTLALLDAPQMALSIQRGDLLKCESIWSYWSGEPSVSSGKHLFVVEREHLARTLRATASDAGALFLCPVRAHHPVAVGTNWIIPAEAKDGSFEVKARLLVDATGRRPGLPPASPKTAALIGEWKDTLACTWPEMVVESAPDVWFWAARGVEGLLNVAVFLQSNRCAGLHNATREALYLSLLGSSRLVQSRTRGAILNKVRATDAACRIHPKPITRNFIRVGDSAFCMDPISAGGIFSAIRFAFQASAVINTVLAGPDTEAALEFYTSSLNRAIQHHRVTSAEIYAAQANHTSEFWRERSQVATTAAVQRSAADLASNRHLRMSAETTASQLPALEGNVIRRRTSLNHPSLPTPVAWIGGVDVELILTVLKRNPTVASFLTTLSHATTPEGAQDVLNWLVSCHLIEVA
jgi:flavin-dependent dehydrogenase